MRRVMYAINEVELTPSFAKAQARTKGKIEVVLQEVVEPLNEFIPKCGKVKPKAVKPR